MRLLRWLADKLLGTPRRVSARAQISTEGDGTVWRSSAARRRLAKELDDNGLQRWRP